MTTVNTDEFFLFDFDKSFDNEMATSIIINDSAILYPTLVQSFALLDQKLAFDIPSSYSAHSLFAALPGLVCISLSGYHAWSPEYQGTRGGAYLGIEIKEGQFESWDSNGWLVRLDPTNGKLLSAKFTK